MHDINPLGSLFHLKELERNAIASLQQQRLKEPDESGVSGFGGSTVAVAGFFAVLGLVSIWLV